MKMMPYLDMRDLPARSSILVKVTAALKDATGYFYRPDQGDMDDRTAKGLDAATGFGERQAGDAHRHLWMLVVASHRTMLTSIIAAVRTCSATRPITRPQCPAS